MKWRTRWPRIFNIEFAKGALQVSSTRQNRGDGAVGLISWSRSRQLGASQSCRTVIWSTLGPASQAAVVAALCSFENLASFHSLRKSGRSHIIRAGFCKILGRDNRSSWCLTPLCDSGERQNLLKDPHFFIRHDNIGKAASEELLWVPSFWKTV